MGKKITRRPRASITEEKLNSVTSLTTNLTTEVRAASDVAKELLDRVLQGQDGLRSEMARGMQSLREEVTEMWAFHASKGIAVELIRILGNMETMVREADFSQGEIIRDHVSSFAVTLQSLLDRMEAKRISVKPGEEPFNPQVHYCQCVVPPDQSPYPDVPPRTVVRVIEPGYTLGKVVLLPVQVVIQGEAKETGSDSKAETRPADDPVASPKVDATVPEEEMQQ